MRQSQIAHNVCRSLASLLDWLFDCYHIILPLQMTIFPVQNYDLSLSLLCNFWNFYVVSKFTGVGSVTLSTSFTPVVFEALDV